MFEFKGLVAGSAKKYNENAGFATPLRKNLVSEKSKVVLGDVKHALNIQTPKADKSKHNMNLFLSTPQFKNVDKIKLTSPTLNNYVQHSQSTSGSYSENHWNECDAWNEKLILSEETFKLLFLEANENLDAPTPPSFKQEPPHDDIILPSISGTTDYGSIRQLTSSNSDDFPPISMEFFDVDFWEDFEKEDKGLTGLKF